MDRRQFLSGAAAFSLAASRLLHAVQAHPSDASSSQANSGVSGVDIDARYRLTLQRVLHGSSPAYTPEFLLEDLRGTQGRRFTNFSGDLSGRWIGALASCSSAFGDLFPVLDEFVLSALPLQHAEGYFGKSFNSANPNDDDLALLWGNGRLLVGLLEYHALHPNAQVLTAARKLGDFLLRIAPQFNSQKMADAFNAAHFASSYICWTQQTEGLAALYVATGDRRYRDLCAEIASRIQRRPGDHVHGYLCSVRGMLELYFATKDWDLLQRSIAAWNDIARSGDLLITGGVPEAWSPKKKRTEGCAECDWLRLSLALYRATADGTYLIAAQNVLFNEFAMNQFSTGDFGHAVLDQFGAPELVPVRAWWCCTLHGLRAFADIQRYAFNVHDGEVFFQLPVDATLNTPFVSLESKSTLGTNGQIHIRPQRTSPDAVLHILKPHWSESVSIRRNGVPHTSLDLHQLRTGEAIEITYGMSLRLANADYVLATPGRTAMHYGPWLLGASEAVQPVYFNELYPQNILLANSAHSAPGHSGPFGVPIAATSLSFIPAEFPEQRGQVQLRPIAEQTGYEPARWMTSFLVRSS